MPPDYYDHLEHACRRSLSLDSLSHLALPHELGNYFSHPDPADCGTIATRINEIWGSMCVYNESDRSIDAHVERGEPMMDERVAS